MFKGRGGGKGQRGEALLRREAESRRSGFGGEGVFGGVGFLQQGEVIGTGVRNHRRGLGHSPRTTGGSCGSGSSRSRAAIGSSLLLRPSHLGPQRNTPGFGLISWEANSSMSPTVVVSDLWDTSSLNPRIIRGVCLVTRPEFDAPLSHHILRKTRTSAALWPGDMRGGMSSSTFGIRLSSKSSCKPPSWSVTFLRPSEPNA